MEQQTGRLRAALISPGSFPLPYGKSSSVEEVMFQLARKLASYADVTIYGRRPRGYEEREKIEGVRFVRPWKGRVGAQYIETVCRRMAKEAELPNLIQVDNRPKYIPVVKRYFPHIPIWLVLHSLTFVSESRISRPRLHRCLRLADRILVNSVFLREEMVRRFPDMAGRIAVNHLGVNEEQFASRWSPGMADLRERAARRLGANGRLAVVYAGRLIPMKGVHHLVSAMRNVIKRRTDVHLFVVGGSSYGSKRVTPYVRKLKRLAGPIRRHVTFVPYVPHERVPEWFRLADVAAVPSFSREAFGLVNVEAMASGAAVLATDGGGISEIVEHGVTGYLLQENRRTEELTERLLQLAEDRDLCRRLGMAGRGRVEEKFLWRHCAARWLAFAEETTARLKWYE